MLDMYSKIAQHYSPEDLAAIGDGFVRMHGIIKKFSDPKVIPLIEKLIDIPTRIDLEKSEPVGPIGLLYRMKGEEYKQGLGVILELTKALGMLRNGSRPVQ